MPFVFKRCDIFTFCCNYCCVIYIFVSIIVVIFAFCIVKVVVSFVVLFIFCVVNIVAHMNFMFKCCNFCCFVYIYFLNIVVFCVVNFVVIFFFPLCYINQLIALLYVPKIFIYTLTL